MDRNEQLERATEDVLNILSAGLSRLKTLSIEQIGPNEARMLELYNKVVSVCLERERGKEKKGKFKEMSDQDLESDFE